MTARHTGEDRPARRRALTLAAVTVCVLLLAVAALGDYLWSSGRSSARSQFLQSERQVRAAVEQQVEAYFAKLADMAAYLDANPQGTAAQFSQFVHEAGTFTQLPSIEGVVVVDRVPDRQLAAFNAAMAARNPSYAPYHFGSVPSGATHFVLADYVPGSVDFGLPVGADITPITSIVQLITYAGAHDAGVVGSLQSDPLIKRFATLDNFPIGKLLTTDFFIGVPVYGHAIPDGGQAVGWVGAAVGKFGAVLDRVRAGQPASVGVRLRVDLTNTGVATSGTLSRVAESDGSAGPQRRAAFTASSAFSERKVRFHLEAWSSAGAGGPTAPLVAFALGGLLVSALAGRVVYLRRRSAERERQLTAAARSRAEFQADVINSVSDPVAVLDEAGAVMDANHAYLELVRSPSRRASSEGGYLERLCPSVAGSCAELRSAVQEVLGGASDAEEVQVEVHAGTGPVWYLVRARRLRGGQGGAVVTHVDVSDQMRSLAALEERAHRDPLTGLLNREVLGPELATLLGDLPSQGFGLLFFDLDHFKEVNDTFGHGVGDGVLQAVARRLERSVRPSDRPVRLGGDEFVVLVRPVSGEATLRSSADRLLAALSAPVVVGDVSVPLSVSIGGVVVAVRRGAQTPDDLIHLADQAMYSAKREGGGRIRLVVPSGDASVEPARVH